MMMPNLQQRQLFVEDVMLCYGMCMLRVTGEGRAYLTQLHTHIHGEKVVVGNGASKFSVWLNGATTTVKDSAEDPA